MEEVIGASDRIAVMHEGRIAGYLDREQFSQENVLLLAVGKQARTARTKAGDHMPDKVR
jgi:ribose transport system ATP-binding protein